MVLQYQGYRDLNLHGLKVCESTSIDAQLVLAKKSKKQYLHNHYTSKKAICLAMINSDRKYYDILSYETINRFWHEYSAATTFKPQNYLECIRSISKAIHIANNTLDSNNGIFNI